MSRAPKLPEIRMSAEGACVASDVVHQLSRLPQVVRQVNTWDGVKTKTFALMDYCDRIYCVDLVTGTLFDYATGRSSSPGLYLLPDPIVIVPFDPEQEH
jgi:hypothetical protein